MISSEYNLKYVYIFHKYIHGLVLYLNTYVVKRELHTLAGIRGRILRQKYVDHKQVIFLLISIGQESWLFLSQQWATLGCNASLLAMWWSGKRYIRRNV